LPLRIMGSHPNPFRGIGEMELESDKALNAIVLEIFNIRGQKLDEIPYTNLKAGANLLPLQLNHPSGIYFMKLKGTPGKARKLVILK
ncbi:MAG: T9SS type A sorting domain-containing protein, partial [Candidatus Cloacimonetes bacterium]|nr:T9SS type A sorting domain-containing protein [Candidatus Cloacimonadota bacterium]